MSRLNIAVLILSTITISAVSQEKESETAQISEIDVLAENLYPGNVVPNSDFHQFKLCPEKYTIIPKSYFVDNWTMPTGGTPDYFNVCSYEAGVPGNWVGHLNPRRGYGYVGLIAGRYTNNYNKIVEIREYIQAELKEPLIAGQTYYVRFFVSLAGYSRYALDGMAASFSDTLIDLTNYVEHLPLDEHVSNPSGKFLDKKGQWTKIDGMYTAKGTEKFIVIGNFRSDAETNEFDTYARTDLNCSYYLVDDILVAPVNKEFIALFESQEIKNIAEQNNDDDPECPDFQPILFEFDKFIVNNVYENTILHLAEYMISYPDVNVVLIGHTDSVGDDRYNLMLSKNRAKEVARVLASRDIEPGRLKVKGKGETEPLNSNENEEQRALNRRVEIKVR